MASLFEPEETVGGHMASAGRRRLSHSRTTRGRRPPGRGARPPRRACSGRLAVAGGGPARRRCGRAPPAIGSGLHAEARPGHGEAGARPLRRRHPRTAGRSTCFPDRADNAALYEWLAAWFARAEAPPCRCRRSAAGRHRPAARGAAERCSARCCRRWPGLRPLHERLVPRRSAPSRPQAPPVRPRRRRSRPRSSSLLGGDAGAGPRVAGRDPRTRRSRSTRFRAHRGYRPFLPVPLWGEVVAEPARDIDRPTGDEEGGGPAAAGRRQAPPRPAPRERPDPPPTTR